jgi:hypothetical protein
VHQDQVVGDDHLLFMPEQSYNAISLDFDTSERADLIHSIAVFEKAREKIVFCFCRCIGRKYSRGKKLEHKYNIHRNFNWVV